MESKLLFKNQLLALAFTMDKTDEISFGMGWYYRISDRRSCGYVACICGEQSLSGRLEFFTAAKTDAKIGTTAGSIDKDLKNSCKKFLGEPYLASSITGPGAKGRYTSARSSKKLALTPKQLLHPHLHTKSNPKNAASYIRMLLKILYSENNVETKNAVQPLVKDVHGRNRFKENMIVTFLLDNGGFDLNKLAMMDFSDNDREQFAQLIGYSLDGYGMLSYVTDETYNQAEATLTGK
jgi:hypothetical protein